MRMALNNQMSSAEQVSTFLVFTRGFQIHPAYLTSLLAELRRKGIILTHQYTYATLIDDRYGIPFGAVSPRYFLFMDFSISLPQMKLGGDSESSPVVENSCPGP